MQAAVQYRPVGRGRGDEVGVGGEGGRRLGGPRQVADRQSLGQVAVAAGQFDGRGFTLAYVMAFVATDKGDAMAQAFPAMGIFDLGTKIQRLTAPGMFDLMLE
ncbi:hypothetical protein D3C78_963540 [compost metagenome]